MSGEANTGTSGSRQLERTGADLLVPDWHKLRITLSQFLELLRRLQEHDSLEYFEKYYFRMLGVAKFVNVKRGSEMLLHILLMSSDTSTAIAD